MAAHEPKLKFEREFELERLIFFSDAVFAIAITLLALELKVPDFGPVLVEPSSSALAQAIFDEWPHFFAFALSFYIIGAFWLGHHHYFRYIAQYNSTLLRINLVLLFFTVLIPYTTSLLGAYGNLQTAIVMYALNLFGVGVSSLWLWRYATNNHRLVPDALDSQYIRWMQVRGLMVPLAALVVIALTFVTANGAANFGWLVLFPLGYLVNYRFRRASAVS